MITVLEKVRYYETDMMGIAHHSNHIRWFECGRVEYMRKAGIDLLELLEEGISYPIKNVSCEYISPIYFDDVIAIETSLIKLSQAQMVYSYRIRRDKDGELLAAGTSQNVFAYKDTGKVARLDMKRLAGLQALFEEDKKRAQ